MKQSRPTLEKLKATNKLWHVYFYLMYDVKDEQAAILIHKLILGMDPSDDEKN